MSDDFQKDKTYYHINNALNITTIDIGHSVDTAWDIKDNYPYYSLNFLLAGESILEINEERFTVKPKQVFLIPPNTPVHYYSKDNTKGVEVYWLNFYGQECESLISMTAFSQYPVLSLPTNLRTKILQNFKETIALCHYQQIQSILCNQLLINIIKYLLLNSKLFEQSSPRKKLTDFDKIMSLINTHLYSSQLNAQFICSLCYITPEHFSRTFKKNMSLHFSSYVNTERIKKASSLLLETDYPLNKIAELVGYGDVYYFCKIFKKYRLMTPTEYRKNYVNE